MEPFNYNYVDSEAHRQTKQLQSIVAQEHYMPLQDTTAYRGRQHPDYSTQPQQQRAWQSEGLEKNLGLEVDSMVPQRTVNYVRQYHHHCPNKGSDKSIVGQPGMPHFLDPSKGSEKSLVGQPGMPSPAPKPRGLRQVLTKENDKLLIVLKERHSLNWRQIAEFFPGRSAGTLQVHYCTRLKDRNYQWTDETVSTNPFARIFY
jgi:hypothetical protein